MNTRIGLVAIDLDGTLIDRRLEISERVRQAVARAQAAGVHVAIVTGRMFAAARPFANFLDLEGPIVCYQGGAIYDVRSGERLQHTPLATPVALEAIEHAHADKVHVQCFFDDTLYLEAINRYSKQYTDLARVEPVVVPSLAAELRNGRETTKIVMVLDRDAADAYAQATKAWAGDRAYVTRSIPEFIELVDPNVDKGRALAFVAQHTGVALANTMGIGDAWNDVPLLRAAGVGIAMGSAPPELREVATAVVGDVAHDGVAEAIERFVLAPAGASEAG